MLHSSQLISLLSQQPGTGKAAGVYAAARRFGADTAGPERRLIDELMGVPVASRLQPPADPTRRQGPAATPQPLSPASIDWMRRLPSDPTAVSFEDAEALAKLEAKVPPGSDDARLVAAVLGPVRRVHEAATARTALDNLQCLPRPTVPAVAGTALAESLRREYPQLTAAEAGQRAAAAVKDAEAQRNAKLDGQIAQAKAAVAAAAAPWNASDAAEHGEAYLDLARAAREGGDGGARRTLAAYNAAMDAAIAGTFAGDAA